MKQKIIIKRINKNSLRKSIISKINVLEDVGIIIMFEIVLYNLIICISIFSLIYLLYIYINEFNNDVIYFNICKLLFVIMFVMLYVILIMLFVIIVIYI